MPDESDSREGAAIVPVGTIAEARKNVRPFRESLPASVSFEPRRADHLQYLVDCLENLPTKKPTRAMLRVQLASPWLLMGKAGFDAINIIVKLPASHEWTVWAFLPINVALFCFGLYADAVLRTQYREALERKDPHHTRLLQRVKEQLAELKESGEEDDVDGAINEAVALSSPRKS